MGACGHIAQPADDRGRLAEREHPELGRDAGAQEARGRVATGDLPSGRPEQRRQDGRETGVDHPAGEVDNAGMQPGDLVNHDHRRSGSALVDVACHATVAFDPALEAGEVGRLSGPVRELVERRERVLERTPAGPRHDHTGPAPRAPPRPPAPPRAGRRRPGAAASTCAVTGSASSDCSCMVQHSFQ